MEKNDKKRLTLFAKISIIVNTLLFGFTGILYLVDKQNLIGILLLAAGGINILYILISVNTTNYLFVVLNFIFALVALIVGIDFLTGKESFIGMVWMIIALYYVVIAFLILLRLNKLKHQALKN